MAQSYHIYFNHNHIIYITYIVLQQFTTSYFSIAIQLRSFLVLILHGSVLSIKSL